MASQVDHAVAGERTGFRTCALIIGWMYGSVTLLVAAMAVLRVTAADAQWISGYAAPVSMAAAPQPLVGDFWPAGAAIAAPSAGTAS